MTRDIQGILNDNTDLQSTLFIRGFLVSDKEYDIDIFPFYGNWKKCKLNDFYFYTHNLTDFHYYKSENRLHFILGHAYNPFTMKTDEVEILKRIDHHTDNAKFYEILSELTGIFVYGYIEEDKLKFIVDPSGMQSACYCNEGGFYLSSHPQLIADLCKMEMSDIAKTLVNYKWYSRVMGGYMPADLTAFESVKRVVPNIEYCYNTKNCIVDHCRFYPKKDLSPAVCEDDYRHVIEEASEILKNSMELVMKKWNRVSQSLTGGVDSNTTFASANGLYDNYSTFSYCSAEKETIDCDAAKEISDHFNVNWSLFNIPSNNSEIDRFEEKKAVIEHNNAYVALTKDSELRKRMYLRENCNFDVEIKSWVSETVRAYWYKHFGRKKMPRLSAKLYRNLYKIFIFDRNLARTVDELFKQYIKDFEYDSLPDGYMPADMHYNEVTWGSWGGMNISEMKYCFDITIIFNNRYLLDLLLRVPLDKRIADTHHFDIKKQLNKELYDMNIVVKNMHETKFRALALNVIFTINQMLPF